MCVLDASLFSMGINLQSTINFCFLLVCVYVCVCVCVCVCACAGTYVCVCDRVLHSVWPPLISSHV